MPASGENPSAYARSKIQSFSVLSGPLDCNMEECHTNMVTELLPVDQWLFSCESLISVEYSLDHSKMPLLESIPENNVTYRAAPLLCTDEGALGLNYSIRNGVHIYASECFNKNAILSILT